MYLGSLLLRERREEEERNRAEEGTGGKGKRERGGEREGPGREGEGREEEGREGEERKGEGRAFATLWHGAPNVLIRPCPGSDSKRKLTSWQVTPETL